MEINQAVNDYIVKNKPDRGSIPRESTIVKLENCYGNIRPNIISYINNCYIKMVLQKYLRVFLGAKLKLAKQALTYLKVKYVINKQQGDVL